MWKKNWHFIEMGGQAGLTYTMKYILKKGREKQELMPDV